MIGSVGCCVLFCAGNNSREKNGKMERKLIREKKKEPTKLFQCFPFRAGRLIEGCKKTCVATKLTRTGVCVCKTFGMHIFTSTTF